MLGIKAQQLSRDETDNYNAMCEAWNNWTQRENAIQRADYELARDTWEDSRQALIMENFGPFTATG